MPAAPASSSTAFAHRLVLDSRGFFATLTTVLSDRLGLYAAMAPPPGRAADDPVWFTSTEVATAANIHERYARELLEAQAVSGVLMVQDETQDALERRYALPAAHASVLTDPEHPDYTMSTLRLAATVTGMLDDLVSVYRTGQGISFDATVAKYALHHDIAATTKPLYTKFLAAHWLPMVPDLHSTLSEQPAPRIADVGCGCGWSSIAMAQAYPRARVTGFDLNTASIEQARVYAREQGMEDRVDFCVQDITQAHLEPFDLVIACECIHDLADPVGLLSAMRRMCAPHGTVLVLDQRVGDAFSVHASAPEQFSYYFSLFHCLPVGMNAPASRMTGTVMRPSTLRQYALEAGFHDVEIVPVGHERKTLYRLHLPA